MKARSAPKCNIIRTVTRWTDMGSDRELVVSSGRFS